MLPILEKYSNIIVVIDRLSRGVIIDRLEDIKAKIVTKWFLR